MTRTTPSRRTQVHVLVSLLTLAALVALTYRPAPESAAPNRIPEPAPYDIAEAKVFPPPWEEHWETTHNPAQCGSCHQRIFEEWNGSMMANAWRDPAWRAAFLLIARLVSTDGHCDIPEPPDGTERAKINPFADDEECVSRFDSGRGEFVTSRDGSLLDGFCSRCHMPANYADNILLHQIEVDPSGVEHAPWNDHFNPTSDNGTGVAFAEVEAYQRNTPPGERGIYCSICHTMGHSRATPFRNYELAEQELVPALEDLPRGELFGGRAELESRAEPAATPNLGYGIGAGAWRLSPHAIVKGEVFGPMAAEGTEPEPNTYLEEVFQEDLDIEVGNYSNHKGFRHTKFERAEVCGNCHDVTNPLTLKNSVGRWVGGFPIERTYTEWATSRYADRPGNEHFDPAFKRDCQTCHMQQDFGQPGTAQTLYDESGKPLPVLRGAVADDGAERPYFSHHFVGGNTYIPRIIGADVTDTGAVSKYPELSTFSFSSKDKKSVYNNAYWTGVENRGAIVQQDRLAWDRLRHAVEVALEAPTEAVSGSRVPLVVRAVNSGSGHNFPTGFPEGRAAWILVRAFDLATGEELEIWDAKWEHATLGVGKLTDRDMKDPNFPECAEKGWKLPAGSPDPYAHQMKAIATLGDGCPTLDLPYATPLNMKVDAEGLPIDANGVVIDKDHPSGLPIFEDLDGDGDRFDDSFLTDTRLRPLPHPEATVELDRYSVIVPEGVEGPVAVVAGIYYQSFEGMVAKKFLGNLADLDTDFVLEPCVLGGACDGRVSVSEPPVVEGAPPVPMEIVQHVFTVDGRADATPPTLTVYPAAGTANAYPNVVVKATFSEPVRGIDPSTFTLTDSRGQSIPGKVDLVGDGTWAFFADQVFLAAGETYTARVAPGICDFGGNCTTEGRSWSFRVADSFPEASGNTMVAEGFPGVAPPANMAPTVMLAERHEEGIQVIFSEPVMNVTPATFSLYAAADCSSADRRVAGELAPDTDGVSWIFKPAEGLVPETPYCVAVAGEVYDLQGTSLEAPFEMVLGTQISQTGP